MWGLQCSLKIFAREQYRLQIKTAPEGTCFVYAKHVQSKAKAIPTRQTHVFGVGGVTSPGRLVPLSPKSPTGTLQVPGTVEETKSGA